MLMLFYIRPPFPLLDFISTFLHCPSAPLWTLNYSSMATNCTQLNHLHSRLQNFHLLLLTVFSPSIFSNTLRSRDTTKTHNTNWHQFKFTLIHDIQPSICCCKIITIWRAFSLDSQPIQPFLCLISTQAHQIPYNSNSTTAITTPTRLRSLPWTSFS